MWIVDDTWRRLVAKSKSEECRCRVRLEVCFKNRICPNTILVLMTRTGIYFSTFWFRKDELKMNRPKMKKKLRRHCFRKYQNG